MRGHAAEGGTWQVDQVSNSSIARITAPSSSSSSLARARSPPAAAPRSPPCASDPPPPRAPAVDRRAGAVVVAPPPVIIAASPPSRRSSSRSRRLSRSRHYRPYDRRPSVPAIAVAPLVAPVAVTPVVLVVTVAPAVAVASLVSPVVPSVVVTLLVPPIVAPFRPRICARRAGRGRAGRNSRGRADRRAGHDRAGPRRDDRDSRHAAVPTAVPAAADTINAAAAAAASAAPTLAAASLPFSGGGGGGAERLIVEARCQDQFISVGLDHVGAADLNALSLELLHEPRRVRHAVVAQIEPQRRRLHVAALDAVALPVRVLHQLLRARAADVVAGEQERLDERVGCERAIHFDQARDLIRCRLVVKLVLGEVDHRRVHPLRASELHDGADALTSDQVAGKVELGDREGFRPLGLESGHLRHRATRTGRHFAQAHQACRNTLDQPAKQVFGRGEHLVGGIDRVHRRSYAGATAASGSGIGGTGICTHMWRPFSISRK